MTRAVRRQSIRRALVARLTGTSGGVYGRPVATRRPARDLRRIPGQLGIPSRIAGAGRVLRGSMRRQLKGAVPMLDVWMGLRPRPRLGGRRVVRGG